MPPARLPENEPQRLLALLQCHVMDTEPEPVYDRLTGLAARLCGTPIALISLLDENRQWFKSRQGLDATQTPRDQAFCGYTILGDQVLVVPDATRDPRTQDNPLVTGAPGIRFYAGAPLRLRSGQVIGTLCVIDTEPRHDFSPQNRSDLETLAQQAAELLQLRIETHHVKALNQELSDKSEELERFVYTVSHDLKSPLVSCMGLVRFMREDLDDGNTDEVRRSMDRIQSSAQRMERCINDLLELSRIGRVRHEPEAIDMDALMGDLTRGLSHAAEEAGASLGFEPGLPQIVADRIRVLEVFENLVNNALKYACAEPGGRITIGGQTQGNECRFFVRDTGPGIDERYHTKVFELFQRLDTTQGKGSGMGLAIVARIMETHRGRVWIDSREGSGATFWVAFPRP